MRLKTPEFIIKIRLLIRVYCTVDKIPYLADEIRTVLVIDFLFLGFWLKKKKKATAFNLKT